MDEVDGMAGNEDRGGVQELIALLKSSKVPIICMCNDRQHPKIRSLANHCFDLRFYKPRIEQIRVSKVVFKNILNILCMSSIELSQSVYDYFFKYITSWVNLQVLCYLILYMYLHCQGAMMSVCFREGVKLKPEALDQIIVGSNQDVRQILHHLSLFSVKDKNLDSDNVKRDANAAKKDLKIVSNWISL